MITLFQMFTNEPLLVFEVVIGWLGARVLSVTKCKQASDWLMARPHWAPPPSKKNAITGPAVSRLPGVDDERG